VGLYGKVILERRKLERTEFTLEPVNACKRLVFHQMKKKTLGQVLGILRRMPAAPSEGVEWIPIVPAQLGQSRGASLFLALRRRQDDRPMSSVKTPPLRCRRTIFPFHNELPVKFYFSGCSALRK